MKIKNHPDSYTPKRKIALCENCFKMANHTTYDCPEKVQDWEKEFWEAWKYGSGDIGYQKVKSFISKLVEQTRIEAYTAGIESGYKSADKFRQLEQKVYMFFKKSQCCCRGSLAFTKHAKDECSNASVTVTNASLSQSKQSKEEKI